MSRFGGLLSSAVFPFTIGRLAWSPDGQWLAAGAGFPATLPGVGGVGAVEASSGIVRWVTDDLFVDGLAISPDGERLAVVSRWHFFSSVAPLWRVLESSSGQEVWRVSEFGGRALFSPDSRLLALQKWIPHQSSRVVLVDAADGRQLRDLGEYHPYGLGAVFTSDWRAAAMLTPDRLLFIDTATGTSRWEVHSEVHDPPQVPSYAIQDDEEHVVVVDLQKVRLFRCDDGALVREMELEGGIPAIPELPGMALAFLAFSPDRRRLVSLSSDIRMFGLVDGRHRFTRPTGSMAARGEVVFSTDGAHVAARNPEWEVYDAQTGERVWADPTHVAQVLSFSPDGTRVAAGGPDPSGGRVQVYDTGIQFSRCASAGPVTRVAVSTVGIRLVATVSAEIAAVFDAANGDPPLLQRTHPGIVTSVLFTPDGQFFMTGSTTGARLFGTVSGSLAWKLDHGVVNAIAMSPGAGEFVGTASNDKHVRVVRRDTGTELWKHRHPSAVNHIAFSADGVHVATGAGRATRLFSADTGDELHVLEQDAPVRALAFSPTSPLLATADDNGVVLIDLGTGLSRAVLPHPGAVSALAFDRKGVLLATGGADRTVRVYNVGDADPVLVRNARHDTAIIALVFIADTGRLAIATEENLVRIVDPTTGEEQQRLIHPAVVHDVAVSVDGDLMATASDTGARVYAL